MVVRCIAASLELLLLSLLLVAPLALCKLNIHLVPHSHDDVGFEKTFEQYYYGSNQTVRPAGVQYILDSVVPSLLSNPSRKFIQVEIAFFQMWWAKQTDNMKNNVKQLIANGQFEFINGGWVMHDEASPSLLDMIDQTTLGHKFIHDEFDGLTVDTSWQIDPFGHSSTHAAYIAGVAGMNAMYMGRIDAIDKLDRSLARNLEFIWQPSQSFGEQVQIFGATFLAHYGTPPGYCWDIAGENNDPFQDDPTHEDYNVPQLVDNFVQMMHEYALAFQGNDLLITMGGDWQWQASEMYYKNVDKLIQYVNADGRINAFYSTPTIYTEAKYNSNLTFNLKTDDFFPYSDVPIAQWTGYFTSRPALKRYVRTLSPYLQIARHLEIFSNDSPIPPSQSSAYKLWCELSVAQHHDGVSGTSRQHVAYDYAKRMHQGYALAAQGINAALSKLLSNTSGVAAPIFTQCPLLNISICDATQTPSTPIIATVFYNPLAHAREDAIVLPVNTAEWAVYDSNNRQVQSQVVNNVEMTAKTPQSAPFSLHFVAQLPPLGYSTYFLQSLSKIVSPETHFQHSSLHHASHTHVKQHHSHKKRQPDSKHDTVTAFSHTQHIYPSENTPDFSIENDIYLLTFSGSTGLLQSITLKSTGDITSFQQTFSYYRSLIDPLNLQNSGAYIFRPDGDIIDYSITNITVVTGPLVQEVQQVWNDYISQSIRLKMTQQKIEFEYSIGPIDISDGHGKEIVSRYSSDLSSAGHWWTDSNGREMMKRVRGYQPTYNVSGLEPISSNYYPITAMAFIQDQTSNKHITVLTDRSEGCSSQKDGEIEVMLHRRTLADDNRGVHEAINETDGITGFPNWTRLGRGLRIVGKQYIILQNSIETASALYRAEQDHIYYTPLVAFTPVTTSIADWAASHNTWTSFANELPLGVEILTFMAWSNSSYLLRLSHQFAGDEDPRFAMPISVDLQKIFPMRQLSDIVELSLTANQPVDNIKPMKWNIRGQEHKPADGLWSELTRLKGSVVTLTPMQIRTFQIFFY